MFYLYSVVRFHNLDFIVSGDIIPLRRSAVPVTVVYGSDSWVTQISLETFSENGLSKVQVKVVDKAGKH